MRRFLAALSLGAAVSFMIPWTALAHEGSASEGEIISPVRFRARLLVLVARQRALLMAREAERRRRGYRGVSLVPQALELLRRNLNTFGQAAIEQRDPEGIPEKWVGFLEQAVERKALITMLTFEQSQGPLRPAEQGALNRANDEYKEIITDSQKLHSEDDLANLFDRQTQQFDREMLAEMERARLRQGSDSPSPGNDRPDPGAIARDPAGALAGFEKTLRDSPEDVDALAGAAAANNLLGRYETAHKQAEEALILEPDNPAAMAALKLSEGYIGGGGNALSAAAEGARAFEGERGPGPAGSYGRLAPPPPAETPLETQGAGRPERMLDLARQALRVGDLSAAKEYAEKALADSPQSPAAHQILATAYARQGDYARALAEADKGLALAPDDPTLLNIKAFAANRVRDAATAKEAASRALRLNPRDAMATANYAYALGLTGDREGMLAALRRAAALDARYQSSLDSALAGGDGDLLFLFPGESSRAAAAKPAAPSARARQFGAVMAASVAGGLLLALGLLQVVFPPLRRGTATLISRVSRSRGAEEAAPPRTVLRGQYEVSRQIAAGGMGLVFEGTDRSLGRRVAVKRMREEIRLDPRSRERFVSEAKTVAALHHPRIVDIYAIVEEGEDLYLVFEFVEGSTLHDTLAARGRLPPEEAVRVSRAAAEALDYAHSRGVIHRDMKPSNLMVDSRGGVKVMDFGIARAAKDAITRYSMTSTVVGTPPYMAPEQEQGAVRKESDVYSLAICAYEMLCGRLPFAGVGSGILLNKINMSFVPPSRLSPSLPAALDAVFEKAFQPDPEKRHHSAGEFAAALESAVASAPARA